ncbi:MAG TPA: hypothetical protein VGN70_09895 [Gammaproteobacteria bacterium]|jgi:hypothetical protein
MKLFTTLSVMAAVCLAGCAYTTSHPGEPSTVVPSGQPPIYDGLISDDQDQIVQKAQAFIRARHPQIDPGFPNIHIRSAEVDGKPDPKILNVLQSLSDHILGPKPGAPTWDADVVVRFQRQERSDAAKAAIVVPELVVCFSTIFIVCPTHYTEEVQLEVHVLMPDGHEAHFVTAGYGDLYESTAALEGDEKNYKDKTIEMNTGGFVAAVVAAADKLDETYKSMAASAKAPATN